MEYVSLQGPLNQIILPQLRCSGVFSLFLIFFCLITFLCAVNYASLTKNFKSIIGLCDKRTWIAIYLFKNTFFGSSGLVHICWIFRWFSNTFGLIFFSCPQKFWNLRWEEGRAGLFMYLSLSDNSIGCLLNFWSFFSSGLDD